MSLVFRESEFQAPDTIIGPAYSERRFERATRDNPLRSPDPLQGPYRRDQDWTDTGWFRLLGVGVLIVVVLISGRHLLPWWQ